MKAMYLLNLLKKYNIPCVSMYTKKEIHFLYNNIIWVITYKDKFYNISSQKEEKEKLSYLELKEYLINILEV